MRALVLKSAKYKELRQLLNGWDSEEKWQEKRERRFSSKQLYLVQQQKDTQSPFFCQNLLHQKLFSQKGAIFCINQHTYTQYLLK